MPQEEKLEVENIEVNFYWFAQRDVSSRTPHLFNSDAVNSLTCHGHRVMIESELERVLVIQTKNIVMQVPK
jgi:hypothetical protein